LAEPRIDGTRRCRLRANTLKLLLKLCLLQFRLPQTLLEQAGVARLLALETRDFLACLNQLGAHLSEFASLRVDLRHGLAGGGGLLLRSLLRALEFIARAIEVLLLRGELRHSSLGVPAIRHYLAQQRVTVTN
jgi:hypothetical protein